MSPDVPGYPDGVGFVGMAFAKCSECGREVRVWESRFRAAVTGQLTEDGAIAEEDGTFECPFCGTSQGAPKT